MSHVILYIYIMFIDDHQGTTYVKNVIAVVLLQNEQNIFLEDSVSSYSLPPLLPYSILVTTTTNKMVANSEQWIFIFI